MLEWFRGAGGAQTPPRHTIDTERLRAEHAPAAGERHTLSGSLGRVAAQRPHHHILTVNVEQRRWPTGVHDHEIARAGAEELGVVAGCVGAYPVIPIRDQRGGLVELCAEPRSPGVEITVHEQLRARIARFTPECACGTHTDGLCSGTRAPQIVRVSGWRRERYGLALAYRGVGTKVYGASLSHHPFAKKQQVEDQDNYGPTTVHFWQ